MIKTITIGFITTLTIMFFSGCGVEPSKISDKQATKMAKNITYFKDKRTGLCFGSVASRKTGDTSQSGLGLTRIPCGTIPEQFLVE